MCKSLDSRRLLYINEGNTNKIIRYINSGMALRVGSKHLMVDGRNEGIFNNYVLATQDTLRQHYQLIRHLKCVQIRDDLDRSQQIALEVEEDQPK